MEKKSSTQSTSTPSQILPGDEVLRTAVDKAIKLDKPIMMDYWQDSLEKKVFIGVRTLSDGNKERILVKSAEEYTSTIKTLAKSAIANGGAAAYIIETENSIYIVSAGIVAKAIS